MNQEAESQGQERAERKRYTAGGASGSTVYGLGLVGAAIYYLQNAETFMVGVVGVLKAIVWPAIVVYKWLGMLG
jgi:hypothetical protein